MSRRRILVPIDLEDQSDSALTFARSIAKRLNAMISCMYVIEEQNFHVTTQSGIEERQRKRRKAEYKLSERVNYILNEAKTPFELIITSGKVSEKILDKSRDLNAQFIIMSKSQPAVGGKKRIGLTTKHILAKSQIPVITTGSNKMEVRKNIVVPLDVFMPIGSQLICAIDTAILLGVAVTVISVIEKEIPSLRPVCLKRLKEIRLLLRDMNIKCNSHLLIAGNTIPEEILSFSRKLDSGMILMMTSNELRTKGSSIGAVAKKVIANSELPVQCINPNYKPRILLDKSNSLSLYSLNDKLISSQQEILP